MVQASCCHAVLACSCLECTMILMLIEHRTPHVCIMVRWPAGCLSNDCQPDVWVSISGDHAESLCLKAIMAPPPQRQRLSPGPAPSRAVEPYPQPGIHALPPSGIFHSPRLPCIQLRPYLLCYQLLVPAHRHILGALSACPRMLKRRNMALQASSSQQQSR